MEPVNILWAGSEPTRQVDYSSCTRDLELGELSSLLLSGRPQSEALAFFAPLTTADPESILLRQGGINDLLAHPDRISALEQARTMIGELRICAAGIRDNARGLTGNAGLSGFKETLDKLERLFGSKSGMIEEADLDNYYGQLFRATIFTFRMARAYTGLLTLLRETLQGEISPVFQRLRDWVTALCAQDRVDSSLATLETLSSGWTGVGSFSVDVVVDQSLNIMALELQEVRPEPYSKPGVINARQGDLPEGLAQLSEFPMGGATARFQECLMNELGVSMKKSLSKLQDAVCRLPVTGVRALIALDDALAFYIGVARFCLQLQAKGYPVCAPAISSNAWIDIKGAYPAAIPLLHSKQAAANDIYLAAEGTVNFITGANSAGKTTYLITAGQCQWLFQLGCLLPCREASLRPCSGLFTLFASGESDSGEDSRMGIEARRLREFRDRMTEDTMLFLNEPMTSTNASEGMEICMDLLCDLISRGISAMMVTHYNEIYGMLQQKLQGDPHLVSYVMEVDRTAEALQYPYRLCQRNPDRSSHAHEIVKQVGVTLPDMLATLQQAGLDVRADSAAWAQLHPESEV